MPCRELTYNGPEDGRALREWLAGRSGEAAGVEDKVRAILEDVRKRGDEALVEYGRAFDCKTLERETLKVSQAEIEAAAKRAPREDLDVLAEAVANVTSFHESQVQRSWWTSRPDGAILGQLVRPLDRVGLYVPGGRGGATPLISSLIMNAVPAKVAGVEEIAVCSPPTPKGGLSDHLLAAASLLGISEIVRAGSAWAVAAMGYGAQSLPAVDMIAGPGNIFVATAKRLLTGRVGLDMIAGPSEIAVLADESADPDYVAADMLSQAEHDPMASCLLITPSEELLGRVKRALAKQLADLPRREAAEASLKDWGALILVADLEEGIDCVNAAAPEHLEILTADPWSLLGGIRHAGAIFLGPYSPEPVGDYFAGPNHVLPTLGTARFSSALSVEDFCKKSNLIAAGRQFTEQNAAKIARLARLEGLEAHARAVEKRTGK
jgi:histidinol dehydrogenase